MPITPLPAAPETTDTPQQFNTKAFAWVQSLDTFVTEANAQATTVNSDASSASSSASTAASEADDAADSAAEAAASVAAAQAAANVTQWSSGATYAAGANVWSPISLFTYRNKTGTNTSTDPSLDSTNWELISGNVLTTANQELSNKTLFTTKEKITVSATAATGTINFDAVTQSVLYYTTDASGDWTLNVRGDGSSTLNAIMATGQVITLTFLATQGATPYYQSAFEVDGSSVTPKWQGGEAPTAGNASGIDAYVLSVIKTADATFTVLGSQTQFA
jgi:hypothetical protein